MAVNKNFVVKNGLEVNDNLLVADVDTQKVGIGTSVSSYELHVSGGIGATMLYVCGVTTVTGLVSAEGALTVGGNTNITGITTLAGGGGITTSGGDFYVGGDLYVLDDIVYDEVTGRNLNITGVSTFARVLSGPIDITAGGLEVSAGISTFKADVSLPDDVSITLGNDDDLELHHAAGANSYIKNNTLQLELRSDTTNLNSKNNAVTFVKANASGLMATTGITTVGVASITDVVVAGASTFNGPTTFNYGAITFANVNATNQNVTGIGTVGILSATDAVVSGAATFNNDITVLGDLNVTGDLSYDEVTGRNLNITGIATIATLVGYSSEFSGAIGFSSQTSATDSSTLVGAAVTTINFIGGGATAYTSTDNSTVNVTLPPAGASIGLAIALGG